jgi:hypothetical protein
MAFGMMFRLTFRFQAGLVCAISYISEAKKTGASVDNRTYGECRSAHHLDMKRQTTQQKQPIAVEPDDGCVTDVSAEAALQREIGRLGEWLSAQGLDLRSEDAHQDEGSRDRLYWHYGYFAGLKQAVAMLTTQGATLH